MGAAGIRSAYGAAVKNNWRFATRHIPTRSAALLITLGVMPGLAPLASGQRPIDCPLRDEPYSIDSPLIDVLLKPEAKAVVDRELPDLLRKLPPRFASTTPPSFASILTLRVIASFKPQTGEDTLAPVNHALAALPVTAADREARCARYDIELPHIVVPRGKPRLLLFEKITGFRDSPSVEAANSALRAMAERNGWALVVTDKGGSVTPAILKKFDAIIWNNVSGDVLTVTQRRALQAYIERGGGFVGVHGSGGDPARFWDWYVDTLIGARFAGHPMAPQFQDARVIVEDGNSAIARDLAPGWTMSDEWYSFKSNPRASGARVIATLDEASYTPKGVGGQDLHMGDHPIAWTRCIGNGRSFYSAIGHRPESYTEPHHVKLLEQGIAWAAGTGETHCHAGNEVSRKARE
jgi:type 1 glutamine amidotransferase